MKTTIEIPTTVNATMTNFGIVTVCFNNKTENELKAEGFSASYVFLEEVARGFLPEDKGVKQLEMAILQFDTNLQFKQLTTAVSNIDTENPWRFAGISALLTLGSENACNEDFNLIALGSRNGPGARDGYPVLNPQNRQMNICFRCCNEAILVVRDAPAS